MRSKFRICVTTSRMKGAGVGGWGGEAANALPLPPLLPSGIRHTVEPKSLPFELICDIHFWLTDPKIFLVPLCPS